jgi:hypothetical protein
MRTKGEFTSAQKAVKESKRKSRWNYETAKGIRGIRARPSPCTVSHLFGIYPGSSITEERFKAAAKITLKRRLASGDDDTSWSAAWLVCIYARLDDSVGALSVIQHFLSHSTLHYMFGTHLPFQIDGNFRIICRYCGDGPLQS